MDALRIKNAELEASEKERMYERSLYLYRVVMDLCQMSYRKLDENYNEKRTKIEPLPNAEHYIKGLQLQTAVNYSNLLSQCGRYVKSINNLNIVRRFDFPMATGNTALKIIDYSHFSRSHQNIMLYFSFHMLEKVLDENVNFPEKKEGNEQLLSYSNSIKKHLGEEYLKADYSLVDFLKPFDSLCDKEIKYRTWIGNNGLALHHLNDIFSDMEVAYDPLHLPSLIEEVGSSIIPRYHGVFNQIKQEYVSARFWIYEGLVNRDVHYSDKKVYLVNTLDYPVYGMRIEQIKAAYRSVYSIFDKIAYFLNKYLSLGISENLISFHTLWYEKKGGKDLQRDAVVEIKNNNYALNGLWWIYKDLRNKTVYKDKHIDPLLSKISKVRNAMEHRYLKILDYFDDNMSNESNRIDDYAYNIGFEDFEKLTIGLLRLTREAIIQLTMIVQIEEEKKEQQRDPNELIGSMSVAQYDDEWKQIG
jgi:hypothetical protein